MNGRVNSYRRLISLRVPAIIAFVLLASTVSMPQSIAKEASKESAKSATKTTAGDTAKSTPPAAPQTVILGDKLATVQLSPEFIFVGAEKAKEFLKKQGGYSEGILGIIAPAKESPDDYFVVCRFEDVGYVNDDDADKLNADEILNNYKEGTKEQNEERKQLNLPPLFIGGWAEKPHYDKAAHQVIWAIEIKDEEAATAPVVTLNYNTRILGRRGVLSLNLVTDPKNLDRDKVAVAQLLKQTTFNHGNTYAEYVPGRDKSAGYGLAGLILGGGAMAAAAKFGVFGVLWKWIIAAVLVLKKFIILAVVAVIGLFKQFFGKKTGTAQNSNTAPKDDQQL